MVSDKTIVYGLKEVWNSPLFNKSNIVTEEKTLQDFLRENRPNISEIHQIITAVTESVQFLHKRDIIHGALFSDAVILELVGKVFGEK